MDSTKLRLVAVTLLLTPAFAFAWGADGHRIVADIASHYLSPEAKAAVKDLLGDQTLAEASTWADEIKSDRKWDWARSLHYANVMPGAATFDLERDCPETGCVVSAIEGFSKVLRDPNATKPKKVEALKFVIHLVGDLHQPLHVSRARDKGGNDIPVEFFGNRTNLHRLWDSGLIRHTKKPWREYAKELRAGDSEPTRAMTVGPVSAWATESYRLALSHAYTIPRDGKLDKAYFGRNINVVKARLRVAGIRLAALLDEVLKPKR